MDKKFNQPLFRAWNESTRTMVYQEENESLKDFFDYYDGWNFTQFIYATDKFDTKIYVGDILKQTLLNGEVNLYKVWIEDGGFVINQFQDDFYKDFEKISFFQPISDMQNASAIKNFQVVGNVFENELLLIKTIV